VRRTVAATLAAVLAIALLAVSCGSDDDGDAAIDPGRSTSSTTTEPAASGGGSGTTEPPTGSLEDARVTATTVARAESPTKLTARPGTDTLYVAERAGTVRTLEIDDDGAGTLGDEPVLDLTGDTSTESERGLLGIAFSADGDTLFASYTNRDGDTRVDAYAMDGESADVASRRELVAVDQPFANHNGGNIVLAPDGQLWLGLGDGGAGGDPQNHAQDPDDPLGKLLRIDPDGDGSTDPDIWAIGLRNPWRFSFDRATDDLWIADVGQDEIEEIDFLAAGASAGTNFGWSGYEGTSVYEQARVADGTVRPVLEMRHDDGWCSVTGGVVYRGERIPDLQGAYLFGDYCKPGLHGLTLEDGAVDAQRELGVEVSSLVSIDEDADGDVYLLSLDGSIDRLDPA
jgi:glucose/arabinose dehydrogenase